MFERHSKKVSLLYVAFLLDFFFVFVASLIKILYPAPILDALLSFFLSIILNALNSQGFEDNVTPRVLGNIRSEGVIKIDAEGLFFFLYILFILLGRKRRLRDALRRIFISGRASSGCNDFLPFSLLLSNFTNLSYISIALTQFK